MTGSHLLDTNIVIALLAGDASICARASTVGSVLLSDFVVGELLFGARKSARVDQNLARIDALITRIPSVATDVEVAARYGRVKAALKAKGRPIPENDIWIAATALRHDFVLVTRDQHFREIDGLRLEAW